MPLWPHIQSLWRNLTQKQRVEADLDEEIRSYQGMLEEEEASARSNADAARRQALLEFGGADQVKEQVRDVRFGAALDSIAAELRQSLRGLLRNPALALTGTAMLALGMGASIVIFSIFYAALVQPLPFRDTGRLMQIFESRKDRGFNRSSFTEANFWDVRAQNHSFEDLGAYHYGEANLTGDGPAEKVTCSAISGGFLHVLGVSPVVGRDFSQDEADGRASQGAVILGNRFWRTRFAADPQVVGRTLRLDDRVRTVIGVLPPGEPWIDGQTYIPLVYRPNANRGSWEYSVIGRLAHGASPESAQADLQRIAAVLAASYPKDDKGIGFNMDPASAWVASDTTRRALWVLLGAVTFLLLIGCLNIANLLLARGMNRKREIAVRTALGAGRARLIRFVMMESLLLSGFGATLGLALAYATLRAIQALEIPGIPRLADAGLNTWVFGFAALIAVLTGILSGLAPSLQAPANQIAASLREGDRQTGSRGQGRLRAILVTCEVALSFLLLVGAGLLIRSFVRLTNVDPGFHTENRLLFSVSMPNAYWEHGVGKQFLDRFFERLSAIPQVVSAGAVSNRPVEGGDPGMGIASMSGPQSPDGHVPWAGWRIVSPGYFRAIGLPLLQGRVFDERDRPVWAQRGQPVPQRHVVISQSLGPPDFPQSGSHRPTRRAVEGTEQPGRGSGRCRGRHAGAWANLRSLAHRLPALRRECAHQRICHSHSRRPAGPHAGDSIDRCRHRSESAHRRCALVRRSGPPFGRAAAVQHDSPRRIRRIGPAAGHHRYLRRPLLFHQPPDIGDRAARRPGCKRSRDSRDGGRAGYAARNDRPRSGRCRLLVAVALLHRAPVRHSAVRPPDLPCGSRAPFRYRPVCLLPSRPPRHAHRSRRGVTHRVTPR